MRSGFAGITVTTSTLDYIRWARVGAFGAVVLLLLASGDPARAQSPTRRVLLLQSFERGNVVLDRFTSTLRGLMDERSPQPLTFSEVIVNPAGFREAPEQAIIDYVRSAFAGDQKPDLVITAGGLAAAFARQHRASLFADSPTVYGAVDDRFLQNVTLTGLETAVTVANDPTRVFRDILQVFPDTQTVFVIMGAGDLGRFWREQFGLAAESFDSQIRFIWSDGMTYAEMLQRASTLPPRSAVYFLSVDIDAQGTAYPTENVLKDLRARASAPIFASQSAELGFGIIGGHLMSIDDASKSVADAALQILAGTPPSIVKAPIQRPGGPVYDWRELQRWGVDEDRLPAGNTVLYRQPGVWERFRWPIVAATSALIVQTILITALLVSRAKQRRAEQALHDSEGRFRRGLIQAQEEERTRVARELHDDICQRMVLLGINLQELAALAPDTEAALRDQIAELRHQLETLTNDVNGISHRLHSSKLSLLGLTAAAAAFCHDIATRQQVDVEFVHTTMPDRVPEGVAISLFRVLQEALSNAVKHSGARRYRVSLEGRGDGVQLEVSDNGRGFELAAARQTSGLGLMSMQERLRLVGGEISFESRLGGGTRVRAWAPTQPVEQGGVS